MYYKLMSNDIVVDLLRKLYYVRYLPKSKRWVGTDAQSAHGIMSSDGSMIYHLCGRAYVFPEELTSVIPVEIDKNEFDMLAVQFAAQRKENEDLRNEMQILRTQLNEQSDLLQQILAKL